MYGQLQYNPNRPDTPWTVSYFLNRDLALPTLTVQQAVARGQALKQLLTEVGKVDDAVSKGLSAIGRGLPADTTDLLSDLYIALAHLQLPTAQRQEREARITSTIDGYFAGTPATPNVVAGITHIKLMAQMAPDAFLEGMVRGQASRLQMISMPQPEWQAHLAGLMHKFNPLPSAFGFGPDAPEITLLISAFFSRPLAERTGFVQLLGLSAQYKLGAAVHKTQVALSGSKLLPPFEGDVLVSVLQDCTAAKLDGSSLSDIDQIVANQVALGRAADEARAQAVAEATIEATNSGVRFGATVQKQNVEAIAAACEAQLRQFLLMTPQRLRLRQKLAQPPAPGKGQAMASTSSPSGPSGPDLDPVDTWSVKSLLRWNGGSINDEAPQPLDRQKVVAKEKTTRQEARVKTKMPANAVHADQDLTEADVDLAVQNALSATAEFFIGDIEDMLFRAKALNIDSPTMPACAALIDHLRELVAHPESDDQKARALLHQAEVAIALLRKDIHASEIDARTRQRFAQRLQLALASEPMVEGKRHGGVIGCPLRRGDWAWVAGQYHQRWLPGIKQITIDGVSLPLQPDQALALYVTGKSLSGYEFDVSVHLWQRKPGRHGAPSTSMTPYAPMNTEDWTDTLTPCAVLHVPSAG